MNKWSMLTRSRSLIRRELMISILIALPGAATSAARAVNQDFRMTRLGAAPQTAPTSQKDPTSLLAAARLLYVHSRSGLVKSEVIESELRKRSELEQLGLYITKDPSVADLTMDVRRSNFTTEYAYVVIDTKTQLVVASGKVNSLFGTAASKIAKGFLKQVQRARAAASSIPKN